MISSRCYGIFLLPVLYVHTLLSLVIVNLVLLLVLLLVVCPEDFHQVRSFVSGAKIYKSFRMLYRNIKVFFYGANPVSTDKYSSMEVNKNDYPCICLGLLVTGLCQNFTFFCQFLL